MEQTSHTNLSNKTIANKIMKNIKEILHGGNSNVFNINREQDLTIRLLEPKEAVNALNPEFLISKSLDDPIIGSKPNHNTNSEEFESINYTTNLVRNEIRNCPLNLEDDGVIIQDGIPKVNLYKSPEPNIGYESLDEQIDMVNEGNPDDIEENKIHYKSSLNNNLNNEQLSNTNDAQSILQELLGKKTFRDPYEYAKTLARKHGNIKCEDVILDNDKYDKDIEMVMKYAESVHPFKVVIEFCQKFKWPFPEIDTFNIGTNENPQFKTTISIKNNTFRGEAVGIQKKISKKNAAIKALTNLLEDPVVRDSLKMFVKGVLLKKEEDFRSHVKIKDNLNEEEDGENSNIKEEEITEKEEKERVEKLLKEFYQNNPLIKLNFFKNKVKIPFSFTYSQKPKIKIATLYVGSEIYGVGEDRNIKIAKYKASADGLKNIIQKYGEDILKTKEERRQKSVSEIKEDIVSDEEDGAITLNQKLKTNLIHINDLLEDLNKNNSDEFNLQRKFELFLLKYERNILPINDYNEMEKILAKLFYVNKTISINFNDPIIVGSFSGDCMNIKNKVIDLIFLHKLNQDDFKLCTDSLINNFNSIFNETQYQPEFRIKNKKESDSLNMDIEVMFKEKDYSFKLLIRHQETNREYIEYLPKHNDIIMKTIQNFENFNILKRLLRSWRRKFNLIFVKPEFLDWVASFYVKNAISESLVKIFHKLSKDFKNLFKKSELVPYVIVNEVQNFNKEKYEKLCQACKESKDYIAESKFEMLFL